MHVAQDNHRSAYCHENPQAPGQVPKKFPALSSPLTEIKHRHNRSREEKEHLRHGGHAGGGDRTQHRRIGKQPFFRGRERESQTYNKLNQHICRKERGEHGCEYA